MAPKHYIFLSFGPWTWKGVCLCTSISRLRQCAKLHKYGKDYRKIDDYQKISGSSNQAM